MRRSYICKCLLLQRAGIFTLPPKDVPKLPSGAKAPKHITIEKLDEALDKLQDAMQTFDSETTSALKRAAIQQELEGYELDIMPREEIFLISSFLLNFSQAA